MQSVLNAVAKKPNALFRRSIQGAPVHVHANQVLVNLIHAAADRAAEQAARGAIDQLPEAGQLDDRKEV